MIKVAAILSAEKTIVILNKHRGATMNEQIEPYRRISIKEAVNLVAEGKCLECVEIEDLRGLLQALDQDEKTMGKKLHGLSCRILKCECDNLRVLSPLCFDKSEFLCRVRFLEATFTEDTRFRNTVFTDVAAFGQTTFVKESDFEACTFKKRLVFFGATIRGLVSFPEATFGDIADFRRAKLQTMSVFSEASFLDSANFSEATLGGESSFWRATFNARAQFQRVEFKAECGFSETTFQGDAYFGQATFDGKLDFSQALLQGNMVFVGANLMRRPCFNFSNIHLRSGAQIRLELDQVKQRDLVAGEDSDDSPDLRQAAEQYNLLRDNFRRMPGTDDEEDVCHYKFKDLNRRAESAKRRWKKISKFPEWAVYKWCLGYAVFPRRILVTGIVVILVFALLYSLAAGPDTIRFSSDVLSPNRDDACAFECSDFDPLYFSVITFTTIGYGDYAPIGWLRYATGLEGLLGLVLTAVFTVSFARKLIR